MKTNEMTPEQSLQVISDAISRNRKDFEKNAGSPMVLWGVVVLLFSIVIWVLLRATENHMWNFLWFGIPVAGWPLSHFCLKGKCVKGAKNFINDSIAQIWMGYGIFATAIALLMAFIAPQHIGPIMIAMLGYGTFMTGMLLKNKYIIAGGIITGIAGAVLLYVLMTYDSALVFSVAAIVSLLLPGIMLNRKNR